MSKNLREKRGLPRKPRNGVQRADSHAADGGHPPQEDGGYQEPAQAPARPHPIADPSLLQPLQATIVYASSEDPAFPASELCPTENGASSQRGWQSAKLCGYPQELILRFDGEVNLNQLQILAHESKIPSKVEVLVAGLDSNDVHRPPSLRDAAFRRLGFLSFISNEKTKFRSREKKTVALSVTAYYVKLVMHKCHLNALNNYNQVGLIQVVGSGAMLREVPHPPPSEYFPGNSPQRGGAGAGGLPNIQRTPTQQNYSYPQSNSPTHSDQNYDQGDRGATHQQPSSGTKGVRFNVQGGGGGGGGSGGGGGLPPIRKGGAGGDQWQYEARNPHPPAAPDYYSSPSQQQAYGATQDAYSLPPPPVSNTGQLYRSQAILDYEYWYTQKTRALVARKAAAVNEEEYDVAKICKDQLLKLQNMTNQIYEYEAKKIAGIYEERFDDAKAAKIRMDSLLEKAYRLTDPDSQLKSERQHHSQSGHVQHGGRRRESDTDMPPEEQDEEAQPVYQLGSNSQAHHAFEDQPVQSKYAQEMALKAQREAKNKPSAKQGGKGAKNGDESPPRGSAADEEGGSDAEHQQEEEEAENGSEDEPEEAEEAEEEEEEEEEEEDEEADAKKGKKAKKKPPPKQPAGRKGSEKATGSGKGGKGKTSHHSPTKGKNSNGGSEGQAAAATHDAEAEPQPGEQPPPGSKNFDPEAFEEWEKAVFFAIQDEMGHQEESASDTPVDPRDGAAYMISEEMKPILGEFCTACLLSRRWKHREAAVKVLTKLTPHLYAHQPTVNVVNIVLKYLDEKGFGIVDPILVCFLASCEYLGKVIDGSFSDCPLQQVQTPVLHLLPRLLLRSGDSVQKSREEALALIVACAKSSIGPERVGVAILADPVDIDKRRVPPQNHRIHISRLLVLQHILEEHPHGTRRGLTVDAMMNKLLIPCLNHSNSELRELAVSVIGAFDAEAQQEVAKYSHLIANPSTKAAVDEKLSIPPAKERDESSADEGTSGGHKEKEKEKSQAGGGKTTKGRERRRSQGSKEKPNKPGGTAEPQDGGKATAESSA
jgi:hypothetical protein